MSISQVSSQTMSAELLEEPHAKEAISQTDATEALATAEPVWLERLASDPKLLNTQAILAPFARGEAETAVIVTLEPTPAAHDLATQSADALNRPSAFDLTESPVFFDLQDQTIRTQLRETVTQAVGQFIANQPKAGLTVTQRFSYQFGFAARVSPAALEQLLADPAVLRVEEDGLMEPHLRQGIPLMAADTPSATFTGSGLSIAIVDTGIDTSHPQLGGGSSIFNSKVIGGYDTGDNDADPRPNSNTGEAHGTACAGIAAGDLGDSGDYIGGVAPGAKLYALKITAGDGGSAFDSAMIAAWEWAISHKNDDPANPILVISTSFGGGGYSSACDSYKPGLTTAAANAVAAGITIFASSGNDGYCGSMVWPACISYVNSVGAVYDASLGTLGWCVSYDSACTSRASANTGCSSGYAAFDSSVADKVTAYSNSASFLSLFAPSNNAYTTDIVGSGGYSTGDYTTGFGGTSAACPYAAGAAAVLQSAAKAKTGSYLTPAQVKSYLTSYGTTITDGKVTSVKKPRIDLASAVNALPGTQLPTVPSGLTATASSSTQINLSWADNSNNETGFYIERKAGSSGTYAQIATVGGGVTSYASTGLTTGTTYYYRVRAYNSNGNSNYSNEAYATTTSATVPTAPSGLTATASSSTQINLSWADNSNNETGFYIERKAGSSGTYAQIATVGGGVTSYASTGLTTGTTYYYRVRAYNSNGNSNYSNEAYATTSGSALPAAPSGLTATSVSSSQIYLDWVDNSSNETGFYIERKIGSGGSWSQSTTVSAGVTSYFSTGLTAGTTYYYRVRAYNDSGNSGYSNEAYASTTSSYARLYVFSIGGGNVTSTPSGVTCGTVCQSEFDSSTVVTLRATPYPDWANFMGWAGACSGVSNCSIQMTRDNAVIATFGDQYPFYVEVHQHAVITGTGVYTTPLMDIFGPELTVTAGSDLTFEAGEQIKFLPGFKVEKNATFKARINPTLLP